jgi:hypothetical protein
MGTGVKTLGKKALGNSGTPASDADSFSITLAFRDSTNDTTTPTRTVSLQGLRGIPSANLVNQCGATGNTCTCDFLQSSTDTNFKSASAVGISQQNNSFTCVIPTSVVNADVKNIKFVRLRRTDVEAKNTGLISISTKLTIEDILGSTLSKTKVRGIFRYSCSRTFFEGEGVSAGQIQCVPSQRLGVISASYNFYTFRSGEDRNDPGGDSAFPSDICKLNSFLKIQCTGNAPDLRYGFYKDSAEPFVVKIQMTRAPEGENLIADYGFAALPDSAGNCPMGLVKVRPFLAQPASIIQGSIGGTNPPSSFVNTNNSLNNTVIEQAAPANFLVLRQPNQTPCAADGDCTRASFAGVQQVQSVAYSQLTPVVCAIPPDLLTGLF